MNKEIKEILEELKEKNETYKECSKNGIIENEYYKSHILLDYITNLQEENERLNNIIEQIKKYIKEARESDSYTILPSGKHTDISYCIVAFEDLLNILKGDNK